MALHEQCVGATDEWYTPPHVFRATSSADIEMLGSIPGDRALEKRLHGLLKDCHIARELFHQDWRISGFLSSFERSGLDSAISYLEGTTPQSLAKKKAQEFDRRIAEARKTKAEKNAYFASLVAQRKERLGW